MPDDKDPNDRGRLSTLIIAVLVVLALLIFMGTMFNPNEDRMADGKVGLMIPGTLASPPPLERPGSY